MTSARETSSQDPQAAQPSRQQARHPIGVVARRTGLKQDLIRAWERRYGAVEPQRSDTNRRFYTDADVERLALLQRAVSAGRSIGQVAQLSDAELEELVAEDRAMVGPSERGTAVGAAPPSAHADSVLTACVEAVRRLDGADLEQRLHQAAVDLGRTALLERVVAPLMARIGELWRRGDLRPVHEHLATAAVRSLVGVLQQSELPTPASSPLLLVTTPSHQLHEVGALLVAATGAAEGWRVTYLGPDLPAEEIAAAARQTGARAVALSITYPPDDPALGDELRRLARLLDPGVALLIGGRSAAAYRDRLEESPAVYGEDLGELRRLLSGLRARG
jgi:DNA-binding transcriptional MerR regulator/methylmalonyl-CoA mutase cobalamin-binding subunit